MCCRSEARASLRLWLLESITDNPRERKILTDIEHWDVVVKESDPRDPKNLLWVTGVLLYKRVRVAKFEFYGTEVSVEWTDPEGEAMFKAKTPGTIEWLRVLITRKLLLVDPGAR